MKKLVFVVPLMAISFLASCGPKTHTYTVTFIDKNETVKTITGKLGDVIDAPTNPQGYDDDTDFYHHKFDGWYDNGTKFEQGATITGNQTFTSKYTKGDPVTYTATFHAKGKDETIEFDVTDTTKTTPETGDTPSTGHTLYWLIGSDKVKPGEEYDFIDCLGSAVDINYSSIANPHKITLMVNGVKAKEIYSAYGEKILSEDVPQTEDYYEKIEGDDHYYHHFTGNWAKEQGGSYFVGIDETLGDADMTIYADFQKRSADPIKYTIRFLDADGETELDTKTIYCPDTLSITAPAIVVTPGYTSKWVSGTYAFNSEVTINFADDDDTKLPIGNYDFVLMHIAKEFTINYVLDGGSLPTGKTNPTTYKTDETITLVAPEQDGFTFSGWYLKPNEVEPLGGNGWGPDERTGNLTLYADWHEAGQTLNDHTWKEISDISNAKTASKYFNIGETKVILMKDDEKQKIFDLRIIDYNRDALPDVANTAGITFDFVDTISHPVSWGNNSRRFTESPLYTSLNNEGDIYKMIETVLDYSGKLLDFVKTVKKSYSYVPEQAWVDGEYETKLFPLSQDEMGYSGTYNYYKDDSKNKRKKNSSYWTRTPVEIGSGEQAMSCNLDGSFAFTNSSTQLNVAPGFCI